jgi:hypothetical protein
LACVKLGAQLVVPSARGSPESKVGYERARVVAEWLQAGSLAIRPYRGSPMNAVDAAEHEPPSNDSGAGDALFARACPRGGRHIDRGASNGDEFD